MAVGQVSFHNDKKVYIFFASVIASNRWYSRSNEVGWVTFEWNALVDIATVYVIKRENAIVNRLNKTKEERVVDHEQERVDRVKKENAAKRIAAAEKVLYMSSTFNIFNAKYQKKQDLELAKAREAEKAAKSYDSLFNVEEDESVPRKTGRELEEDFM